MRSVRLYSILTLAFLFSTLTYLPLFAQSTEFDDLLDLARRGDSSAQFSVAVAYDEGEGVAQNDTLAVYWSRKSAEQGNAGAQYNLGTMYGNGEGVEQNDTLAVYWFRTSAEQGYEDAWVGLFWHYYLSGNTPEAYKWLLVVKFGREAVDDEETEKSMDEALGEIKSVRSALSAKDRSRVESEAKELFDNIRKESNR